MSVVTAISELLDLANEIQRTAISWVGSPAINGAMREGRRWARRKLNDRLDKCVNAVLDSTPPELIGITEMLDELTMVAAFAEAVIGWECHWMLTPEGLQEIRDAQRHPNQPPIWPDNPEMRPYHPSNVASLTAYTRAETPFRERVSYLKDLRTMLKANL